MEFGGREIMLVLGVLVLVAIVLDTIRRVRRSRYERIRMPRRKQPIFDDDTPLDEYGSELPSGGARVVSQRDEADLEEMTRSLKDIAEASKPKLSIPSKPPEQSALDLGEGSLDEAKEDEPDLNELSEQDSSQLQDVEAEQKTKQSEPEKQKPEKAAAKVKNQVLVLHLMSAESSPFKGDLLLKAFLACGLRYGDMKIFHCHESEKGDGKVLFSLASSVNPGFFELKTIAEFRTPGISLFFATDDVSDPSLAFEKMLTTAEALAKRLRGQLRDENREPLTAQKIEDCRQIVAQATQPLSSGTT